MPNLQQAMTDLRGLPDQALQQELQNPSGMIPSYLVLAEAQRRQTLRQAAQRAQTQPSGSVYDEVIRNLMARQPAPGPPAPVGMAVPGQQRMAAGGSVDDWEPEIQQVADNEDVPPDIVREVMRAESRGNPNAKSPKGAYGLMQLLPGTAADMGVDPRDPVDNLTGGARYLHTLYGKYGDWRRTLAAYNAGEGNVDKYGGIPPFRETKNYVNSIMQHLEAFPPRRSTANPEKQWPTKSSSLPRGPVQVLDPETMQEDPQAAAQTQQMLANADAGALPPAPAPISPTGAPLTATGTGDQTDGDLSSAGPGPLATLSTPPAAPAPPGATPAPGPAPAPAPAPAPTPSRAPTMSPATASAVYGDPELRAQLKEQIARLQSQADRMAGKPKLSDVLMNLGFGMAAGTSPFFGVNLGLGGQAAAKGIQAQQEEGRKAQLALLGVDLDLDKEMTTAQEKAAAIQQKAIDQTVATSEKQYDRLSKMPGAIPNVPAGNQQYLAAGYTFTADPHNPSVGTYNIGSRKATPEMVKLGLTNPLTQKPYAVGEDVPIGDWMKMNDGARSIAVQGGKTQAKPLTAAAQARQDAIAQLFREHTELQQPVDENGNSRPPKLEDVPAELEDELHYNQLLQKGMTEKLAEEILVNPHASQRQKDMAQGWLKQQVGQVGAKTTATTTARTAAQAAAAAAAPGGPELTPQGQKELTAQSTVGSQFDDLIRRLDPYKTSNNPLYLAGALAKYKLGMSTPEGELGNQLSNLSLASIQAMLPFAKGSRNYRYLQEIAQHLPKVMGWPPDSPALIYDKMLKARRNFLRMDRSSIQFEQKHGGANVPAPLLDSGRAQTYMLIAGGDADKAQKMAQEDGWRVE